MLIWIGEQGRPQSLGLNWRRDCEGILKGFLLEVWILARGHLLMARSEIPKKDQGMTVIEVVVAITIFLIGIGFIMQSDAVSYRYRHRHEVRQQMIFYAAGQLEAYIEDPSNLPQEHNSPFNQFAVQITKEDLSSLPPGYYPQKVTVTVSNSQDPDIPPVSLSTYRVYSKS